MAPKSPFSSTVQLTVELINCASVTPEDGGCQTILASRLQASGFTIESLHYDDTENLFARYGTEAPLLVFLGHTDVVPPGPTEKWLTPPFEATIKDDGFIYGRGAADMKSGVAAMVTAMENVVAKHKELKGSIALLVTSDEEGTGKNGVMRVMDEFAKRKTKIDWCIVGEPSSVNTVGDMVKNGRRGSLGGKLTVRGQQGHVAYPHLAANPIHLAAPAIAELCGQVWDNGNEFFDPTGFQISNMHSGTGADNVIPGELQISFNFRFCTELTPDAIKTRTEEILRKHNLEYDLEWKLSGVPYLVGSGSLLESVKRAIKVETGIDTSVSTTGGVSDGRFVAPTGAEVIEVGLVNATIHKINEGVKIDEIDKLSSIYEQIIIDLMAR